MINSLEIKNIQSHRHSLFEFHPGLNVIVGPSDSGKSAVIRSLRLLRWNRPLGDAFCSSWGGDSFVKVNIDNNINVAREEKPKKLYILNDLEFTAFGTDVPDEIVKALNIDEVNLQSQMDRPFLLSDSPGDVAIHFNKIAKFDKINSSLSAVESWITQLNNLIGKPKIKDKPATGIVRELENKKEELDAFENLDKFEADVEVLEQLDKDLTVKTRQYAELKKLIAKLESIETEIEEKEKVLLLEPILTKIEESKKDRDAKLAEKTKLRKLVKSINDVTNNISQFEKLICIEKTLDLTLSLIEKRDNIQADYNKLKKLYTNAKSINIEIEEAEKLYNKLHDEFEDNFPDTCPLCGK